MLSIIHIKKEPFFQEVKHQDLIDNLREDIIISISPVIGIAKWTPKLNRLFAAELAEHVSHIYKQNFDNDACEKNIEIARAYANDEITKKDVESMRYLNNKKFDIEPGALSVISKGLFNEIVEWNKDYSYQKRHENYFLNYHGIPSEMQWPFHEKLDEILSKGNTYSTWIDINDLCASYFALKASESSSSLFVKTSHDVPVNIAGQAAHWAIKAVEYKHAASYQRNCFTNNTPITPCGYEEKEYQTNLLDDYVHRYDLIRHDVQVQMGNIDILNENNFVIDTLRAGKAEFERVFNDINVLNFSRDRNPKDFCKALSRVIIEMETDRLKL